MYAIVSIAGFQEKVEEGATIRIPLRAEESGKKVTFEKILMIGDGDKITIGSPFVSGASVEAQVIGNGRADKIRVVKAVRRKRYRRVKGHRQDFTEVKVTKIAIK